MYKLGTGIFIFWSFWKNVSLDLSTSFTKTNFMVEIMSFKYINKVEQWSISSMKVPKDNLFIMKDRNLHFSHQMADSDLLFLVSGFHTLNIFNEQKLTSIWCYIPNVGSTQVSRVRKLFSSMYLKLGVRF